MSSVRSGDTEQAPNNCAAQISLSHGYSLAVTTNVIYLSSTSLLIGRESTRLMGSVVKIMATSERSDIKYIFFAKQM